MFFVACADGPRVEICVIDSEDAKCDFDKASYRRSFDAIIGYVCFKPRHFGAMLDACSRGEPIAVDPCLVGPTDLQCPDKRLEFKQAINYACVSTDAMRKIVKWCVDND